MSPSYASGRPWMDFRLAFSDGVGERFENWMHVTAVPSLFACSVCPEQEVALPLRLWCQPVGFHPLRLAFQVP